MTINFFSGPGFAWACRVNEAQPRTFFRAQAEPGREEARAR